MTPIFASYGNDFVAATKTEWGFYVGIRQLTLLIMTDLDLRSHRRAVGISQIKLARIARVSRFRIHLNEVGEGDLTAEEQGRIKKALKAEADRLRNIAASFDLCEAGPPATNHDGGKAA